MVTINRISLIVIGFALVLSVSVLAGIRYGLMLAVGLGFGLVLEGLRFGFAGPWRQMILNRNPSGILAQLLSIGLVSIVALPLIAAGSGELVGAQAPIGFAMIGAAFIFGVAMQVVLGCGSGTLVNAGSGNPIGLAALPFFALGSFAGAWHVFWWTDLGALPILVFTGWSGLAITLTLLLLSATVFWHLASPKHRNIPAKYLLAAVVVAALAVANLIIAGQPWGVVYGLGLWVAKLVSALGGDLSGSVFWAAAESMQRVNGSVLLDYTSLTNMGILCGAFFVASWRSGGLSQKLPRLPLRAWASVLVAGFLLGYTSRLAFGCNVGAFFSGISTGSLHGWVWFVAAFGGSMIGVRLRPHLGLELRK